MRPARNFALRQVHPNEGTLWGKAAAAGSGHFRTLRRRLVAWVERRQNPVAALPTAQLVPDFADAQSGLSLVPDAAKRAAREPWRQAQDSKP